MSNGDIFVVTKNLQEVNGLKESPGRRDRGIGKLPKDPISALDFKDLSVWHILNIHVRKHGLIFTVIRIRVI